MSNEIKINQKGTEYILGGLYEFRDTLNDEWKLGTLKAVDAGGFQSNTSEWFVYIRAPEVTIGTVTKAPIQLDDGKCYKFTAPSKTVREGYYIRGNGLFITSTGNVSVAACTNIIKLVPEVK